MRYKDFWRHRPSAGSGRDAMSAHNFLATAVVRPTSFERFGRAIDLYAILMRTGFSSTRIYMPQPPHTRCCSDRTLAHELPLAAAAQQSPGSNPQEQQERNTSVTSLTLNPALSAFARATGKVAGQAAWRTLTLVSLFFEAFVEARAMMSRRQAIGAAVGAASNERSHDSRLKAVNRLSSRS
jgi:hypothetical protein